MISLYDQFWLARRAQRYIARCQDPDPLPVAVALRAPVVPFVEPVRAPQPLSGDDQCAVPLLEPACMDRGS